jgi:enamine deaminase RidA (YjgF/YER057c/UK114 family)
VGEDDAYRQTQFILEKTEKVLQQLGANFENVVRTRIYVTDINKWEQVGRAHGEVFKDIKPATAMVEVSALIDHRMLVEIEFTAWVG